MENKQFKTREEMLQDSIDHFWGNNKQFCAVNGQCRYTRTDTSDGCAIGRFLPAELSERLDAIRLGESGVSNIEVFNQLPTWMKELGRDFLLGLQQCHDSKLFLHRSKDAIRLAFEERLVFKEIDFDKITFP